jgi:hypothetical protein
MLLENKLAIGALHDRTIELVRLASLRKDGSCLTFDIGKEQ